MALLHRFSKLNDRSNTGIFTFIVTRSVTRDLHRDATTKDFYYGYHRWAISFTRANDKVLGVYLILRDTSPLAITYTDFSITLLNREHFSRNEQYFEKQCKFSSDHPAHGINKWIPLSDIQTRNFGDETGEFLLELSLSNLMTVYETNVCLQSSGGAANNSNSQTPSNNPANPASTVVMKNGKLETSYFHYATFEWNISIVTHNQSSSGPASMVRGLFKDSNNDQDSFRNNGGKSNRSYLVFLNRLTGFENACRIQYRIVLGQDQLREDSGMIEQISDMNGRSRGYQIDPHIFAQLTNMGMANLYFEFYSCNPISEVKVPTARSISPTINCYDRNKQGWSVESDMESENLKLKLYFMDMHSVPRNHLRYVSWFIYVITQDSHSGTQENIMAKNSPHYNYYIQDGIDMGVVMETDIPVADIKSSGKKYLENDKDLTIQIEWYDSIMLFNHIYHKYDDIARMHCHQMRREISALTSENYSLERQIFAYQRSISMANNQINVTNNLTRLSISSPSKPSPPGAMTGFGTAPTSAYRSAMESTNTYYHRKANDEITGSAQNTVQGVDAAAGGGGYYGSNDTTSTVTASSTRTRPEAINYSTERSATPVPSSPMHQPQTSIAQQQQQIHQLSYLGSDLDTVRPNLQRHSFSGPATPQHHQYHSHQQQQQQQQQAAAAAAAVAAQQQQMSYTPLSPYHHQLPPIPNSPNIPYSNSGYHLRSSNPNIAQMYRDDNAVETLGTDSTSVDDAYQTYSNRGYNLTALN